MGPIPAAPNTNMFRNTKNQKRERKKDHNLTMGFEKSPIKKGLLFSLGCCCKVGFFKIFYAERLPLPVPLHCVCPFRGPPLLGWPCGGDRGRLGVVVCLGRGSACAGVSVRPVAASLFPFRVAAVCCFGACLCGGLCVSVFLSLGRVWGVLGRLWVCVHLLPSCRSCVVSGACAMCQKKNPQPKGWGRPPMRREVLRG